MSGCGDCKTKNEEKKSVPYIVYESAMARTERSAKRMWAVIILLIVLLVGTNVTWLWYESQFETITTEVIQENADGYNNYIGNDGDISNGKADNQDN